MVAILVSVDPFFDLVSIFILERFRDLVLAWIQCSHFQNCPGWNLIDQWLTWLLGLLALVPKITVALALALVVPCHCIDLGSKHHLVPLMIF